MMQVILHQMPAAWVRFEFKWRNWKDVKLNQPLKLFLDKVDDQIKLFCGLKFEDEELEVFNHIPYFKRDYYEFLRLFSPNYLFVKTYIKDGEPRISIEGPWLHTIIFEVPILAIVSELYTQDQLGESETVWWSEARTNLDKKIHYLKRYIQDDPSFKFSDFGTRRRASRLFQSYMIETLKYNLPNNFVGSSNVYLSQKYGMKPKGTMAHQFLQAFQQLGPRLIDSQKAALQAWADEYRGHLGIALSDVMTFDAFMVDFDLYFAKLFDGCRHDSGSPFTWGNKLINHYQNLGIDPKTKTAIFSDGLTFEKAIQIYESFKDRINVAFGIGTYLTFDIGIVAPQIVIKMVECNGKPVAKIPDSSGKGMCEDEEFLHYFLKVIKEKVNAYGRPFVMPM